MREVALRVAGAERDRDGDAAADRRRRVRHGAHQRSRVLQRTGKELQRASGHDRHDEGRRADHRCDRGHHLIGDLRLHRDDDGADGGQCRCVRIEPHAAVG